VAIGDERSSRDGRRHARACLRAKARWRPLGVCIYSGVFEAPDGVAYLGHFAEDDQFDDSSQVAGLQAALSDRGEAHSYPGTKHWFIETDRPEYDAEAAELAYTRTVEFLRQHLA
jgi:carboxymethylenebutenolidase